MQGWWIGEVARHGILYFTRNNYSIYQESVNYVKGEEETAHRRSVQYEIYKTIVVQDTRYRKIVH